MLSKFLLSKHQVSNKGYPLLILCFNSQTYGVSLMGTCRLELTWFKIELGSQVLIFKLELLIEQILQCLNSHSELWPLMQFYFQGYEKVTADLTFSYKC